MEIINAKQFAKRTGYPLAMIRALCREGRLSHWQRGRVYWLEESEAIAEMQTLKSTSIHKRKTTSKPRISRKPIASGSGTFNFKETIRRMQAECKS